MISRAMDPARFARVRAAVLGVASTLGVLACAGTLAASLAPASPAAAACANETLRQESNTNPTTGQPYSAGLPDCRAYEMVSPLYKQGHDAEGTLSDAIPVAPGGETVGWASLGSFSNPENYPLVVSTYLSHRGEAGWTTSSVFAPRSLVDGPFTSGIENDSSPDLRSVRATCGVNPEEQGQRGTGSSPIVVCARREAGGSWSTTPSTPPYRDEHGIAAGGSYLGGSSDLSRLFIRPSLSLLPTDTVPGVGLGIYEIAGCCRSSSPLRLVNVDNEGNELRVRIREGEQESINGPFFGDWGYLTVPVTGSEYHAISASGGTVFFTATPNKPKVGEETVLTVYARVNCTVEHISAPSCKEDALHNGEKFETVAVSNPSETECPECSTAATRRNATFQGASADGSKVFFTTKQRLLSKEPEGAEGVTPNLYEYDFRAPQGQKLVLLSNPETAGAAANVAGVVRISSDGSHVYFVAKGVLTSKENRNKEKAQGNKANLYGYDTETKETKFVAAGTGQVVEGIGTTVSTDSRHAQTTPDGRYLVFSSPAALAGDTNIKGCTKNGAGENEKCPQAVYRYDFKEELLTWVSRPAPEFSPPGKEGEGLDAFIAPVPASSIGSPRNLGADANIDDWNRAISGCPTKGERSEREELQFSCPEGNYDGEYIIFTTVEKLQASDVNGARDVYEWHNGTVSMISDGSDPLGLPEVAMSASGSDIFFITHTPLVRQDTDVLGDFYDARIGGGFRAPAVRSSCSDGACQGSPSTPPTFPSAASSLFSGGANLTPPSAISVAPSMTSAPKPLTRAQQLAKALKACKGRPKRKRARCESQARKKFGKAATKRRGK
jgi:hypothetical protein